MGSSFDARSRVRAAQSLLAAPLGRRTAAAGGGGKAPPWKNAPLEDKESKACATVSISQSESLSVDATAASLFLRPRFGCWVRAVVLVCSVGGTGNKGANDWYCSSASSCCLDEKGGAGTNMGNSPERKARPPAGAKNPPGATPTPEGGAFPYTMPLPGR